jgi:hypothetical protein
MPLTIAQIRVARALIRWSVQDLARETALSVATIRRAELTENEISMTTANDLAVRRALEAAGVEFIDGNGGDPGVPLRKPHQSGLVNDRQPTGLMPRDNASMGSPCLFENGKYYYNRYFPLVNSFRQNLRKKSFCDELTPW